MYNLVVSVLDIAQLQTAAGTCFDCCPDHFDTVHQHIDAECNPLQQVLSA